MREWRGRTREMTRRAGKGLPGMKKEVAAEREIGAAVSPQPALRSVERAESLAFSFGMPRGEGKRDLIELYGASSAGKKGAVPLRALLIIIFAMLAIRIFVIVGS